MMGIRVLYMARGGPISGSQRQLLNLLARIDRAKFTPLVVCSEGGSLAEKLAEMKIETHTYPCLYGWRKIRHLVHRYQLLATLLRQLSKRNIRLIHCSYQWYAPYSLYISKKLGCQCLVHIRAPVCRSRVRKYGYVRADHLITISSRSQKNLLDAGICPGKISLIYDGIDTNVFRPMPRESYSFDRNGDFVFGLVGRISPAKYQLAFIRAASIVASRHAKAKFVLVGQRCQKDYAQEVYRQIRNSALADRIVLYGQSEKMPSVLNSFDVLVSLSGGSIMYEAMACGVPVLSAGYTRKEDSVHVVHDHNAMLIDSREPGHLAQAMERMLVDRCYTNKLASNTQSQVLAHLDNRVMVAQTQAVYEQLLNQCLTE